MNQLGWGAHACVLLALVVNLWFGGDLVEAWLGHLARSAIEILLIGAWLVLVVGIRAPWLWRSREGRGAPGDAEDRRE
ncbi:MAG: hypothetical protein WC273_08450 [Dehalococcoidia bacterium]